MNDSFILTFVGGAYAKTSESLFICFNDDTRFENDETFYVMKCVTLRTSL